MLPSLPLQYTFGLRRRPPGGSAYRSLLPMLAFRLARAVGPGPAMVWYNALRCTAL